jgi:hypothetical protein
MEGHAEAQFEVLSISKLSGGTEEHYKKLSQDSATADLDLK